MTLTDAQQKIVSQICSLQEESLKGILIRINLGENSEGETYESIFEDLELTRDDFDEAVIDSLRILIKVSEQPENLFELLHDIDIDIFEQVMFLFRERLEREYPKAYENLKYKIFVWKSINHSKS